MAEVNVRFPPHLRRFINLPTSCDAEGESMADLMDNLENQFAGVKNYLLHENGELRQHVNLFLDGKLVVEKQLKSVDLGDASELVIMQALSGG